MKFIKTSFLFLICVILTNIVCMKINYSFIGLTPFDKLSQINIDVNEINSNSKDIIFNNNSYLTTSSDSWFMINLDSRTEKIHSITIVLDGMEEAYLNSRIYFSEDTQFNEFKSIQFSSKKGSNNIFIPLENNINYLRFDLSDASNKSYNISKIIINNEKIEKDFYATQLTLIVFIWTLLFIGIRRFKEINLLIVYIYNKLGKNTTVFLFFNLILILFFKEVFFGNYKIASSNFMYASSPWNSLGLKDFKGPYLSDSIDAFLPALKILIDGIKKGEFYFWNPYIGMGVPQSSSISAFIMQPLNWLYLVFKIETAFFIYLYMKLLICLYGMYLLLGRFKLSTFARLFGAISFSFSGQMIVWLCWPHTTVVSFMPIFFYCMDKMIDTKKIKYFVLSILLLATMFYSEMPAYISYFLLIIAVYIIFKLFMRYKFDFVCYIKPIVLCSIVVILSTGISFAYIGTLIKELTISDYIETRKMDYYKLTLDYNTYIKGYIFPINMNSTIHKNEWYNYFGIISLCFSLIGFLWIRKDKYIRFWFINVIVLFLIVHTHLLDIVIKYFPVLNTSPKFRMIILLAFSASILSSFVFDKIFEKINFIKNKYIAIFVIIAIVLTVIESIIWQVTIKSILPLIIIIMCLLFIYLCKCKKIGIYKTKVLFLAIVIIDIMINQSNYKPLINKNYDFIPITDSIKYLEENADNNRVVAVGEKWFMFPNTFMFYKIQDVRSHNFVNTWSNIRDFNKKVNVDSYDSSTSISFKSIDNISLLNYAGVKYIMSREDLSQKHRGLELIKIFNDGIFLYENTEALSRVYISHEYGILDDSKQIFDNLVSQENNKKIWLEKKADIEQITEDRTTEEVYIDVYSPNYIRIVANLDAKGMVVLSDNYESNWQAKVDGVNVDIFRVNSLFRGVEADKGIHIIEYKYNNKSFEKNILISIVTFIVFILFSVIYKKYQKKRLAGEKNEINHSDTML